MKYVLIALIAFLFVGCDAFSEDPAPAPIVITNPAPEPTPDPEPVIPDKGVGSVSAHLSCDAGIIKIKYTFKSDKTIDSSSFFIVHTVNGEDFQTIYPAVNSSGNLYKLSEDIYVAPNESGGSVIHTISIQYLSDSVYKLQSFTVKQPACEAPDTNVTADIYFNIA